MKTLDQQKAHAETVLEAIQSVLEGRATHDVQQYEIGGRPLSKTPIEDLMRLEKSYLSRLARIKQQERIAAGYSAGRTVQVKFV